MRTYPLLKSFSTVIFTMFLLQPVLPQKNFTPGYVVRLDNDTVHGYIKFNSGNEIPPFIIFKKSSEAVEVKYSPAVIKAFGINKDVYESAIVKVETSSDNPTSLTNYPEFRYKIDTTFLMLLVKGNKSLYYYPSKSRKDQFYIRQDSGYQLLNYKRYLKMQTVSYYEEQAVIAENKEYISQLFSYLKDCPTIVQTISNSTYTIKSLEKVFDYYYKCTKSEMKYRK